jgi:outer membrane protein OmpA-like peptidoglycan-associated protein
VSNRTLPILIALLLTVAGNSADVTAQQAAQQPQMTILESDFIPGEKTIFYDDFTDMSAGEAPKRFKSRGAAPELRAFEDVRQLTATANGTLTANLKTLPANFTYEADVLFEAPVGSAIADLLLMSKDRQALLWRVRASPGALDLVLSTKVPKYEEFGRKRTKVNYAQPVRLALWVQDGRVRAFVNGEKHLDFNQIEVAPIDRVDLQTGLIGKGVSVGYRTVRFAESAPDVADVLTKTGRYVSHAILFDTGSDRLKAESAAPINAVARTLQANAGVKLLIEGHTDSVGDAARNLDLSKRRAEAVKHVLVSQFSIDPSRLTTAGLGATKPIDTNDTPPGRAQNRRVEFVKQ